MNKEQAQAFIRGIAEDVVAPTLDKCGDMPPMFLFHSEKEQAWVSFDVSGSFANDSEKALAFAAAKQVIAEHRARWVLYVAEAWQAIIEAKDWEKIKRERTHVQDMPQRQEIITYQFESDDFGLISAHQLIKRDDKGKPSLGELRLLAPVVHAEGAALGFLPKKGAKQ